jgi:hypothetical protein
LLKILARFTAVHPPPLATGRDENYDKTGRIKLNLQVNISQNGS